MPESMWVPFDFPSTVAGLMANAGEVTRLLRWGHGEILSESLVVLYLGLGTEPTVGGWSGVGGFPKATGHLAARI